VAAAKGREIADLKIGRYTGREIGDLKIGQYI
jgi:hypothetical protein